MNREAIIRMAEEAGFFIQQNEIYSMSTQSDKELTEWIERFAALVTSAEREECAKECDIQASFGNDDERFGARQCSYAIRSRGQA